MKTYPLLKKEYPIEYRFEGDNVLLMVKPLGVEGLGFEFKVLSFMTCPYIDDHQDIWFDETEYYIMFKGEALHDGLRHLWCEGEHVEGYLNYPNPKTISDVMLKIRELEEEYCHSHYDSED